MADFVDFSILLQEDDDDDKDYEPVEEEEEEVDDDAEAGDRQINTPDPETDLIASRTRSKFQIKEVVSDTLQLPDVEPDLYDLGDGEDFEWTNFCKALFADDPVPDAEDDEDNDPEYVAGDDTPHGHDKLDSSLIVPAEEADSILDDVPVASLFTAVEDENEWKACLTPDHLNQLKDQFSLFVQLLGQQYFMCRERQTLLSDAYKCAGIVAEIQELSETSEVAQVENLEPLISLMRQNPIRPVKSRHEVTNWRKCCLSLFVKDVISQNPHVFVCEKLIPKHGYYDLKMFPGKSEPNRAIFFPSEDDLIIIGIQNFRNHENSVVKRRYCKFIQELILPSKTEQQIKGRIKNLKQRFDPENRLSAFLKDGTVQEVKRIRVDKGKTSFKASDCPRWLKTMLKSPSRKRDKEAPTGRFRSSLSHRTVNPFKQAHSIVRKYKLMSMRPHRQENMETGKTVTDRDSDAEDDDWEVTDVPADKENSAIAVAETSTEANETGKSCDEETDDADAESEMAALMAASSTITHPHAGSSIRKKNVSNKQEVLTKQKEIEQKILSQDWDLFDPDQELRQQTLVEYFMQKARDVLRTEADFVRFLRLLSEFHESRRSVDRVKLHVKQIFNKLETFLREVKAERLIDELILFLDQCEAMECGKMFEFLYWKRFTSFMRKIEVSTTIDPQMLVRLFKTLTHLKQNPEGADKFRVKSAITKALNGHPLLVAEFMTLFLDEAPSPHLFKHEQDFDIVNFSEKDEEDHSFEFSAPIPAENESLYGTSECPCTHCHRNSEDRTTHCHRCCITVIDNQLHFVNSMSKPVIAKCDLKDKTVDCVTPAEVLTSDSSPQPKKQRLSDEWSTAEDAVLLKVVQSQLTSTDEISSHVFEGIARQVNKTVDQVSARFEVLMQVIRELPSPEKNCNSL